MLEQVAGQLGGQRRLVARESLAIAAGIVDGLGFGDNTKAALLTRGLVEITRLARKVGARASTFTGLAGIGDLITTSFSRHGRNRAVGEKIGRGMPLSEIVASMHMVAEGVPTTKAAVGLANSPGFTLSLSTVPVIGARILVCSSAAWAATNSARATLSSPSSSVGKGVFA